MTTITHEQYEAARKKAGLGPEVADGFLHDLGITIADPEPPEAMVKLAEQIAYDAGDNLLPREYALAALQFADKVVRECEAEEAGHYASLREGVIVARATVAIRRKLGAIE